MQTVKDFVNALGGTVAVATELGAPPSTVSSWVTSGSIPRWRMDGIRALAARLDVPVPEKFAPPRKAA